jgi:hypothetical protein
MLALSQDVLQLINEAVDNLVLLIVTPFFIDFSYPIQFL